MELNSKCSPLRAGDVALGIALSEVSTFAQASGNEPWTNGRAECTAECTTEGKGETAIIPSSRTSNASVLDGAAEVNTGATSTFIPDGMASGDAPRLEAGGSVRMLDATAPRDLAETCSGCLLNHSALNAALSLSAQT
jgi:hypothetical protein